MTRNNIILPQPESTEVLDHQIPSDGSARLNFGPQDISGFRLGEDGELIISFVDGGQLNLTNFDELIDNGNLLYLEDGTLIDPSILTTALTTPQSLSSIETAGSGADAIKIAQPGAAETNEVTMESGKKYVCDFDPANAALVEVKDGQMVLTFADGSQVVINNYSDAMAGELPAQLTLEDGTVVDGDALITSAVEIDAPVEDILEEAVEETETQGESDAAQVANIRPAAGENLDSVAEALQDIEPAAGEGPASNSGYGFNSEPVDVPLNSPDAIGPLGPTALRYSAPEFQQEFVRLEQEPVDSRPIVSTQPNLLDETNLSAGNLVANGQINANFGDDSAGAFAGNNNFTATCNLTGGVLASGGVAVDVTFDELTNTYTGVAGPETVFTMVIDIETGEYTYTQFEPFDHSDTANDNEDICLDFGVAVSDNEGDTTTVDITVRVLDDAPLVFSQVDGSVDETNLSGGDLVETGQFFADAGQDVPATYEGTGDFAATGSVDNGALTSGGVAVIVTYDAGTNTYTGAAGATTVFTMVIDPSTGEYTYTQFEAIDHADDTNPDDVINLEFGGRITDYDGDSDTATLVVKVFDDGPVTGDDENTIDESNLNGGTIVINDSVSVDFGADGTGQLLPSGSFAPSGSLDNGVLSHNGSNITVTQTANGYEGTTAGGLTVFTLEIDASTGAYVFTLLESLDHADDTDPDDVITLTFGTEITDFEGDSEPGQIIVNIKDDAPEFKNEEPRPGNGLENVDETDLDSGDIVETGTLTADFGADAPGSYQGSDSFTPSGSLLGGDLTSNGESVVVTFDAGTNTYTGAANGTTIFTLVIDPATGDYTYTQTGTLDHADGTDPDDVITLTFGVDAVDSEGEAANGSIIINVADDAPELDPAFNTVDETDLGPVVVSGSVTPDYGNDGAATTEAYGATGDFDSSGSQLGGTLTSNGVAVVVTYDAGTNTYTGAAGATDVFTMLVNEDGSYEFTLLSVLDHADPNDPNDIINLDFGIGATDYDGDTAESFIRIQVKDDVPTIGDSAGDVDETNFDGGPLVYQDVVDNNSGQSITSITSDGTTSSSTPLLSGGVAVVIAQTATGYTGTAGATTVFTLTIDPSTGQYTYTQLEPLDHPDDMDANDVISIDFGIEIVALDGTTDDGTITINIADDGPVAVDDINGAEEGQLITGNVVANDELSEDVANNVTNVNFDGVDYPIAAGGQAIIDADFGVLTINSDGTYNYVTDNNDPDGTDVFTYTLTDFDGDSDTATLSITVTPDGQPVAVSELLAVDETNLTPGPMIFNGDLDVDFGIDGAGTVEPNGGFTPGGSLLGGTLTSGGVPIVVDYVGNTYTGVAGATTVFTLQINNDGTYTFQLFDHIDHADNTDPNDIITLDFGVTVSDFDNDTTDGIVTIHVYDDAPVAYDDGTTALDESQTVTGNVTNNDELSEDRPNDVVEVIFNGVTTSIPAVGTESIVGNYGILTIDSSGAYSYKANDNNPEGTDTFTYVLEDFDGDQDTAEISFKVSPDDDVPVIVKPEIKTVDDTDLDDGPNTVGGTISADYGTDGPGEINPNGLFSSSEATLSSCGNPVDVTLSGNTYTGSAGGETVFTMTITEDGQYTFTQFEPLTHADTTDHNDELFLNFGVTASDSDDDTASTSVTVRVLDDGPDISNIFKRVYEGDIKGVNPAVVTNTVPHDFGEDGPGTITAEGSFAAKFQVGGPDVTLTSEGDDIIVTNTDNSYTGTADGRTVFTLDIDPLTGEYTFKLFDQIDHPDATNPDDVIWLKFLVTITDCDGDTDTAYIVMDVHDDGPVAKDEKADVVEGETITGNVMDNDDVGTDKEGVITEVTFNGVTTQITQDGAFVEVNGAYGLLEINNEGEYKYTANNVDVLSLDVFTYTLQDFDGDTDRAELKICVDDNGVPTEIKGTGETDDTNLAFAPDVENGDINVNYNGDGPGTTTGNGNFNSAGNQTGGTLSHNGTPIIVNFDAPTNTYTGLAGGIVVFTMTINSNETYSFTQFEELDHSDTTNDNEDITLNFGVTATDNGGDTGEGFVSIKVLDDAPTAEDDIISKDSDVVTGNVTDNDSYGEDGAGSVTQVEFAGQTFVVPEVGTRTIEGNYGTLEIDSTGEYTYTQNPGAGGETVYSYSIDNPAGSSSAGDIKNVDTSYNATTDEFTFSLTVEPSAEGFTLAINGGPNPKGHGGEMALFYFDASTGTPVVTAYNYNGLNTQTSWMDGSAEAGTQSPDQILSSITNAGAFANISVTTDADGNNVFSFTVDATVIQDHVPTYGDPNDWSGVEFADQVGIWLHPVSGLDTSYDADGYLTQWDIDAQSWYDTSNQIADKITTTGNTKDSFIYTLVDGDGDSDTAELCIELTPDDVPVIVKPDVKTVDDSDLDTGSNTVGGTISADYGNDGPGEINPNGEFTSSVQNLKSCGNPVDVTLSGNTYTGTANGVTVFTMTVAENGTYSFTQFEPLTHPDSTDPNDSLLLNFGVTASDSDDDTASTTVTVRVLDDGPYIGNIAKRVYEGDINGVNPAVVTNTVSHDFGEDGPGSITANGTFQAKFQVGGPDVTLSSQGVPITVTNTDNGYTGIAGGETIFTLDIDPLTGDYTFKLFDQIDHPDETNPDDVIWLKFHVTITDCDGDTDTGIIMLDVHDDGPIAVDDHVVMTESQDVITGNVINNDDVGTDEDGSILQVKFDGQTFDIPTDGSDKTINGDFGALTINKTGAYSYDLYDDAFPTSVEVLPFIIKDTTNGVTMQVTATQNANGVEFSVEIVSGTADLIAFYLDVDGDGGPVFTAGGDSASNMNGTAGFDYGFLIGTSGGNDPDVTQANVQIDGITLADLENGLIGVRGMSAGTNEEGSFKAVGGIDTITVKEECVEDKFEYVLQDFDGDTDTAILKVKAYSDKEDNFRPIDIHGSGDTDDTHLATGPVYENGEIAVNYQGDAAGSTKGNGAFSATGNLTDNTLSHNGVPVSVTFDSASNTYTGMAGSVVVFTMVINANESYSFVQYENLDHSDVHNDNEALTLNFGVTATDADGDSGQGTVKINVRDDGPTAKADYCTIVLPAERFASNVLANDNIGQDANGSVKQVIYNHTTYDVTVGQITTVLMTYGRLEIKADGSYEYILDNPDHTPTNSENLKIVIQDGDGDTSKSVFQLNVVGKDLQGTEGKDTIYGSSANDVINGNGDDDWLYGKDGHDTLHGNDGYDFVDGGKGNDTLYGGKGNDVVVGRQGDDTIHGGEGNDNLYGDGGVDDTYVGKDTIYGGDGDDYAYGGKGEDTIHGGNDSDALYGGDGNDIIHGDAGDDHIIGQQGDDYLSGGSGADTFWFTAINEGLDTIKDFNTAEDKLELSNVLTGYDAGEDLNDFLFAVENAGETTLFVDANGGGNVAAATAIVTFEDDVVSVETLLANNSVIV